MENGAFLKDSQIIVLGICIGVATIVASVILSQGAFRIMKFTKENITVTGSAQKEIRSDYIVWACNVSRQSPDLAKAYVELKADTERVIAYLKARQVNEKEMTTSQVRTEVLRKENMYYGDSSDVTGYLLTQNIEVKSHEVDKISLVSRESTELISQGIKFVSEAPGYFYTDLSQLKIEMLAMATQNAKKRAESIAGSVGNKIGWMRSARMGVFQITPVTSTDISDYGENDTSSLDKKVMSVVSASFAIE